MLVGVHIAPPTSDSVKDAEPACPDDSPRHRIVIVISASTGHRYYQYISMENETDVQLLKSAVAMIAIMCRPGTHRS